MPQDYRRFNGPEDSIPYQRFTKEFVKTYDEHYAELLDENGKRKDGRALDEARSMYARTNMVSQAKGSSFVELKKTKAVCSVFDPREIPHLNEFSQQGQIFCEVKFAPFACKGERRSPAPDAEEKALAVAMRQALEPCVCRHLFPNYQIDIFVYILENDGSCLAAAINSAGLALANAAVPMFDIITSVSLAIIGDQIYVDPSFHEETLAISNTDSNKNHGTITLSALPSIKQISEFRLIGSMDMECITKCIEILEIECVKVLPIIQRVIVADVVKNVEEKKLLEEDERKREELLNAKVEEWKELLKAG